MAKGSAWTLASPMFYNLLDKSFSSCLLNKIALCPPFWNPAATSCHHLSSKLQLSTDLPASNLSLSNYASTVQPERIVKQNTIFALLKPLLANCYLKVYLDSLSFYLCQLLQPPFYLCAPIS